MEFQSLNNDQRRERINTEQRFAAWSHAKAKVESYRGSLVWQAVKGEEYLVRSYYASSGVRRQKSLGRRSPETERLKEEWERGREQSKAAFQAIREVMARQSAVNRVLGLGRVPMMAARIIRVLDEAGLLGRGIRVVGTNAIYAYEAAAGVTVDSGITSTEDIDLLMDARRSLKITVPPGVESGTLLGLITKADKTFERSRQEFRAVNRDGYLVDLIRPQRNPPWKAERSAVSQDPGDLISADIEGLAWHENAPPFETVAIDEKGGPLRIVASDPRVFAAHKLWLSKQPGREPVKRRRDAVQAGAVAAIVAGYLVHLPYDRDSLKMLPQDVFDDAADLFRRPEADDPYTF